MSHNSVQFIFTSQKDNEFNEIMNINQLISPPDNFFQMKPWLCINCTTFAYAFVNSQDYGGCSNRSTNQYSGWPCHRYTVTALMGLPEYEHSEVRKLAG